MMKRISNQIIAFSFLLFFSTGCFEFESENILSDVIIVSLSATSVEASSTIVDTTGLVTRFGHVWSEFSNPEIFRPGVEQTEFRVNNFQQGEFKSVLSNLLPNRTYFVRAYMIINEDLNSPVYSKQASFVTDGNFSKPDEIINILGISDIKMDSAKAGGNIEKLAPGSQALEYGHVWSTESQPDVNDQKITFNTPTGETNFVSSLEGLLPGTQYYVRAYMITSESNDEVIYSTGELNFTTTNN